MNAAAIDAALQCRMDRLVGSLEIEKHADLVVLEEGPLTIDPVAIKSIKVVATWLDGSAVTPRDDGWTKQAE
jgi:predicted amidohydrolase YtcJ